MSHRSSSPPLIVEIPSKNTSSKVSTTSPSLEKRISEPQSSSSLMQSFLSIINCGDLSEIAPTSDIGSSQTSATDSNPSSDDSSSNAFVFAPPPTPAASSPKRAGDCDDKSTSDATGMTGDTKKKLFKVVQKQAEMVNSLTTNNMANAVELERMRKENDRLHRKLSKAQKKFSGRSVSFASTLTPHSVETEGYDIHDNNDPSSGARNDTLKAYDSDASTDDGNHYRTSSNVAKSAPPVLKKNGRKSNKRGNDGKKAYADPLPERTGIEQRASCASRFWASFAFACTFFVPSFLICRSGPAAKQAWREKITICAIAVFVSAIFVGLFGFVPLFFCTETSTYTFQDIWAKDREAWTVIHGTIYDMKDYVSIHPGGSGGIVDWLGKDSSRMFPRVSTIGQ